MYILPQYQDTPQAVDWDEIANHWRAVGRSLAANHYRAAGRGLTTNHSRAVGRAMYPTTPAPWAGA